MHAYTRADILKEKSDLGLCFSHSTQPEYLNISLSILGGCISWNDAIYLSSLVMLGLFFSYLFNELLSVNLQPEWMAPEVLRNEQSNEK